MTTDRLHPDLSQLGDRLEAAVAGDLGRRPARSRGSWRHTRKAVAAAVSGGVLLVGAGSAAAAYTLLSGSDVAQGMPGSSAIFTGTDPACTTTDHVVFHCTLAHAPTVEVLSNYTGTKETFSDPTGDVAGGCIGEDAAGLTWTCFAGQQAVSEGIIGASLLGQHQDGPAYG